MKFLHLSDLHLGKSVHEFSMLEDQEYILKVILGVADDEKPQAVLISGDVFDRTVAPTEALRLFDDFLDGLVRRSIEVFIISGNHDSADRLAFGSRMMNRSGVYISPVYDGKVEPIIRTDEYGEVAFFLIPFLKPVQIRKMFPDIEVLTWSDAVNTAGSESNVLSYTVKIDKDKPTITATANTTDWTNTAPVITVEAFANSGIAEILYSENNGDWQKLDGDTLTANDGICVYKFKAISVSGMVSEIVSVTTKTELTAPELTAEIDGIITDWTSEKVTFALSSTNINSGVTYYVNYGDGFKALKGSTITIKDNGIYDIEVKAVNTAGSESNVLSYTVKIDKDKPTITVTNSSDGKWTAESVTISIDTYAYSEIQSILYTLDGVTWDVLMGDTLSFDNDCDKTVAIKAVSNSGLESDVILTDVKIEKTAPIINVSFKPVKNNSKVEEIAFGLSSENTKSGATYYYNDGSGWKVFNANELLILNIKSGKYTFKVVNGVGNSSEISDEFKIDVPSAPNTNTNDNKNNNTSTNQNNNSSKTTTINKNNNANSNSASGKSTPKVSYYQYSKDGVNWANFSDEESVNTEKYIIRPVYKDGTVGEEIVVYITKGDADANSTGTESPSEPTVSVDKDGDKNDGNGPKIVMLFFGLLTGAGATSILFIAGGKRRKKESD